MQRKWNMPIAATTGHVRAGMDFNKLWNNTLIFLDNDLIHNLYSLSLRMKVC